jgi:hypothetical protein
MARTSIDDEMNLAAANLGWLPSRDTLKPGEVFNDYDLSEYVVLLSNAVRSMNSALELMLDQLVWTREEVRSQQKNIQAIDASLTHIEVTHAGPQGLPGPPGLKGDPGPMPDLSTDPIIHELLEKVKDLELAITEIEEELEE